MFIFSISSLSAEMLITTVRPQNLFMFNNHHLTDSISKAIRYAKTVVQEQIGKDEPPASPQHQPPP